VIGNRIRRKPVSGAWPRVFDIVNGFISMPRCIGAVARSDRCIATLSNVIWLRLLRPHLLQRRLYAGLSLMVWILKREVRAFGGCLGMYRRRRTWHAAISVGEL